MRAAKAVSSLIALLIAAIVALARLSPSSEYELSIYSSTPFAIWVALGLLLLISLMVVIIAQDRILESVSITGLLSGLALFSSLPLLRGYYFMGHEDSMTHLGWMRNITGGELETLYPLMHIDAIILMEVLSISDRTALMLFLPIVITLWPIFTGLLTREIISKPKAFAIGAAAGALLLPLQPISTHIRPHPTTAAMLLLPLGIYFIFRLESGSRRIIPISIITFTAISLYHPQQGLNLILIGLVISITYYAASRISDKYQSGGVSVYPLLVLTIIFWTWAASFERFIGAIQTVILRAILGIGSDGAQTRESSLQALDISLLEIGAKFSSKYIVFSIFVIIGVWQAVRSRDFRVGSLALSMVPIVAFFGAFVFVGLFGQFTRYASVLAVLSTIIGAVSVVKIIYQYQQRVRTIPVRGIIAGIFCLILVLSLPMAFASPYLLQSGGHVTESRYNGYEHAIKHADSTTPFVETRTPVERIIDAEYGGISETSLSLDRSEGGAQTPDHFGNHRLEYLYDGDRYLLVADADYEREIELYQGYRYNESDYKYLKNSKYINQVGDTNGAEWYQIKQAPDEE